MSLSALSDPAMLAAFERACAIVLARGSGIKLRELATASALAEAFVAGDQERMQDMAARRRVSPALLSTPGAGRRDASGHRPTPPTKPIAMRRPSSCRRSCARRRRCGT